LLVPILNDYIRKLCRAAIGFTQLFCFIVTGETEKLLYPIVSGKVEIFNVKRENKKKILHLVTSSKKKTAFRKNKIITGI
jgi:hypothetical protein